MSDERLAEIASASNHEVVGARVCVMCLQCLFTYSVEHSIEESPERYDCPVCALGMAESLIEALADPDPCQYDHHDLCQAHSLDHRPCPHEQAREYFALPSESTDAK